MEGDNNPKFFHAIFNQRCNSSWIDRLRLENGVELAGPEVIHEGAISHFMNFLMEQDIFHHQYPNLKNLFAGSSQRKRMVTE